MTSVGQTLRQERLRQGVDLADIAQRLCVTQRYLRAVEEDDIKVLPGGFFYKSFARQYAAVLGLDEQAYSSQLEQVLAAIESPPLPGRDDTRIRQDPVVREAERPFYSGPRTGRSAMVLLAVLAGCSGFYAWWYKHRAEATQPRPISVAPAVPAVRVAPAVPAAPVAQPVALGEISPPSVTVSASEAQPGPGNLQHIVLNLSATEKTWLSISSDGKVIFSGILEPGQSKTLSGREVAKMRVGNAGGIAVLWNGKPVEPIGPRGQVRVVLFTPDNYQILPAESM